MMIRVWSYESVFRVIYWAQIFIGLFFFILTNFFELMPNCRTTISDKKFSVANFCHQAKFLLNFSDEFLCDELYFPYKNINNKGHV